MCALFQEPRSFNARRKFESEELQQEFYEKEWAMVAQAAVPWCILLLFINVGLAVEHFLENKGTFDILDFFLVHLSPTCLVLAFIGAILLNVIPKHILAYFLSGLCLLSIGWFAYIVNHYVNRRMDCSFQQELGDALAALQQQPTVKAQIESWARNEITSKAFWVLILGNFLLLDALRMVVCHRWTLLLHFAPFLSTLVTACWSSMRWIDLYPVYISAFMVAMYTLISSVQHAQNQYSQFLLSHQLQQTMKKEAEMERHAHEAELVRNESTRKADSMLNHILKNIMADASGCISLFLDQPLESHLQEALECLKQGMLWCKKRQTMLRLTVGKYVRVTAPINLTEFGTQLVRMRNVQVHFLDCMVLLDPTLCDIVLDNAICNAFRHGHPDDPQVTFSMALSPPVPGRLTQQLTFCVTNHSHPERPQITEDFMHRVVAGEMESREPSSPALSDHIGLSHMITAAEAHDMSLWLTQQGSVVTFEVSFDTEVVAPAEPPNLCFGYNCSDDALVGLRVFCIDDSAIARRVLSLNLVKHMQANVKTFGEVESELEEFVKETLRDADIAVLDQHLQYGDRLYYGTDLVVQLLQEGFAGLICLRSANCEEEDVQTYKQSGAHSVIGKDVSGCEFVAMLKSAYLAHLERAPSSTALLGLDSRHSSRLSLRSTAPTSSLELRTLLLQ
eukprot:GGOE01012882.1.p1 GENE.GGOE01012882.1~~GGOE01012882.1.p1  ORF type:complete len:677 (-),score=154.84 GGOE01012882.1:1081-3111(-)